MSDGSHQRKSTLGGVAVALALFAGGVAVCYDERREPPREEVAAADSGSAPARVDTILDDGRTVVTSDGWTRSDGLKFRHENGVLHIDSGSLGGPLPPAAAQPPAPPPAPADTETAAPATTHLRAGEALWVPVGRWSGQGQKETPRFRVGAGEWRLVTTAGDAPGTVHGRVQVQVVDGGGRTIAGVTLLGPAADTGYVHAEPGLFHLRVGSFGAPWTVVVEEKRVPAERLPGGRR